MAVYDQNQRAVALRGFLRETGTRHGGRLAKFGSVGLSGVAVNYAVLYLLAGAGGLNVIAAATLATEAAILSNFALNDLWTFRDARKGGLSLGSRALRYNFFALGGLGISVGVLAALTHLLHVHYLTANLFAIGAATLWNYTASYRWTWSTLKPLEPAAWWEDERG